MMKYGAPTMVEMESLEQGAEVCRKLGLDFLELNINFPQYTLTALEPEKLKKLAVENNIFYTLHLDDHMNIADFNPAVARAYADTVVDAVFLSKELGIPVINMHLSRGGVVTLPERKVYLFDQYRDAYLHQIIKFRDRCQLAVGSSGIRICVENTDGYLPWQQEAVEVLLQSPVFGLTLDTGHDLCTGGGDLEFIERHNDRLHHMHLHDALRPNRDHLALGTGGLNLHDRLTLARKCDCTVVLEIKTVQALRESVAWLRDQ